MTRAGALILCALLLAGCADNGDATRPLTRTELRYFSPTQAAGAGKRLIPFTTLAGYTTESDSGMGGTMRLLTGVDALKPLFRQPVALAAGAEGVYVIDALEQALYRFRWQIADPGHSDPRHVADRHGGLGHAEVVRLRQLNDLQEPNDLFVAPNGDLFIADGRGGKVVRYDKDGNPLKVFASEEHLRYPVAVTVDARMLRVFVADGLNDRILVFNAAGTPLYAIGSRGDHEGGLKNIRDMVQGRDGMLYVVNGLNRQIQIYGLDGSYFGSFGRESFTEAAGIAVDEENRIYLSDLHNHRIQVYVNRRLVETVGSQGTRPGQFSQPTSLWHHGGRLYVAERDNARVQVLRTVPEGVATGREGT